MSALEIILLSIIYAAVIWLFTRIARIDYMIWKICESTGRIEKMLNKKNGQNQEDRQG